MDQLQVAVFLSIAGAFLLGIMAGLAWNAAWAFGAGYHAAVTELAQSPEVLRAEGAL